jgi:hypothetical protein
MVYSFLYCLFFLLFFNTNIFGSIENQLVNLRNNLKELENSLAHTPLDWGAVPDEILEMFFLNLIPNSIDSSKKLIKTFESLNNLALTNKRAYEFFKADIKIIRRRLLNNISSIDIINGALIELKKINLIKLKKILDNLALFIKPTQSEKYYLVTKWAKSAFKLLIQGLTPTLFENQTIIQTLARLNYFKMPQIALQLLKEPSFNPQLFIQNEKFMLDAIQEPKNHELAHALLERGLDPNSYIYDESILYRALMRRNYDFALELLEKGANLTTPADNKNSFITYAIAMERDIFYDKKNTILIRLIKALVKKGLDPNAPFATPASSDRHGNPLFYAIQTNDTKLIKFLLNHNADPDIAVAFATIGCGKFLISHLTPLQFAQKEGKEEIVKLLRTYKKQ